MIKRGLGMGQALAFLGGLLVTLLGVGAAQGATPIRSCPFTITAPGQYVLTDNLGPCPGPAITITAGNVHLNLAGFTVAGTGASPAGVGIDVVGVSNVQINGGRVTGFDSGIVLDHASQCYVNGMVVAGNQFIGIDLLGSSNNQFSGNEVTSNGVGQSGGGYRLLKGSSFNEIISSDISGSGSFGVHIDGNCNDNTVLSCSVNGASVGIEVQGDSTTVHGNGINGGSSSVGIALSSSSNTIQNNIANGNFIGIVVNAGATGNTLQSNEAVGNAFFDLEDSNANCDSNLWKSDVFMTANQTCIH